ncbi:flavin reductase family protein [bacterium]|jgi:flavin reductase (DIM6/NTAB) family NADH-FMN oxidoreductase RutF|nr:flavin reductase family protein [bacterium]
MNRLGFTQIDPASINDNLIRLIASDWMLVTAGTREKFNTMTANWGGTGYLWRKPVVFVFVRPERYTYEFIENREGFTLTFFDEKYRHALDLCGAKSGRDIDKVAETGLTPHFTELGYPAFTEARLVMECRKLYANQLTREAFLDSEPLRTHYSTKGGLHKMYIAEIEKVWARNP